MIDIYLTNRDLLTPIQGMVSHLLQCDESGQITIIDCGSTFPPLVEWYASLDNPRVVVRRETNLGNHACWDSGAVHPSGDFYFASDSDLDLTGVPFDFLTVLCDGLIKYPETIKAALSLRLDDLPADAPLTASVLADESKFWTTPIGDRYYRAEVDTAAAMYRTGTGWGGYGPALRTAEPYAARHLPWYVTPETLSDEWRHYFANAHGRGLRWSPLYKQEFQL